MVGLECDLFLPKILRNLKLCGTMTKVFNMTIWMENILLFWFENVLLL